jgi:hypothetical protein
MLEISFECPAACGAATEEITRVGGLPLSKPGTSRVLADGNVAITRMAIVDSEDLDPRAPLPPELHHVLDKLGRPDEEDGTFQLALRDMLNSIRRDAARYGGDPEKVVCVGLESGRWLLKLARALRSADDPVGREPSPPEVRIPWELHEDSATWETFQKHAPKERQRQLSAARRHLWGFAVLRGRRGEDAWHRENLVNPDLGQLTVCAEQLLDESIPYSPTATGALVSGLMFHEVAYLSRSITGDATGRTIFFHPQLTRLFILVFGYGWRLIAALLAWHFSGDNYVVLFLVVFALLGLWRSTENERLGNPRNLRRLHADMQMAYSLTLDGVPADGVLRYAQSLTERGAVWRPKTLEVLALMARNGSSFTRIRPEPSDGPVFLVPRP